ncbi:cytochrome b/b6 domain-containing protein [Psychromicrobium lacuslunae]|uniref:Cytochrome b561 bacterial/Ni-hydrogenase domain-containing protein n=1 Tax=Psychromicrobium lacuslunae TaxID=1618207 RepID=A0A0D4C3D0_9MICC|nr:cytochrome b/b6 domain-containing protein [Psychromicrobium lacuslunae]AJT43172.1 hypothetical protein UM93_14845 [Psychromicrobium lacuslunae]
MAEAQPIRRGLPREPGGEPWPPAGVRPFANGQALAEPATPVISSAESATSDASPTAAVGLLVPEASAASAASTEAHATAELQQPEQPATATFQTLRRGLPRVPGGEPWPPAPVGQPSSPTVAKVAIAPSTVSQPESEDAVTARRTEVQAATVSISIDQAESDQLAAVAAEQSSAVEDQPLDGVALRRGLPRSPGGEPWPAAALAPQRVQPSGAAEPKAAALAAEAAPLLADQQTEQEPSVPVVSAAAAPLVPPLLVEAQPATSEQEPELAVARKPRLSSKTTKLLWWAVALVLIAGGIVLLARGLRGFDFGRHFIASYHGQSALPSDAPVGLPLWLQWQHFLNVFLMVLIIRSGWQVRTQERAPLSWTSRWPKGGGKKISLTLWFHQALDLLWLVNGVIFVVLLFSTGQWMRVVPTSWDVFPNALSAAWQYASLSWPTENGWVNYNALQLLAYFTTIFIAAPLAALSGFRMSGLWPKKAKRLSKAYPIGLARAVHFPVMLYFVVFIIVHVTLVLATGALRNLNHMYGNQDAVNWFGFVIFACSLLLIAGAWFAARPLILAPIAKLFGKVGR